MFSRNLQLARNVQQLHTSEYFQALNIGLEQDAWRFAERGDYISADIESVRAEFAAAYAAKTEICES